MRELVVADRNGFLIDPELACRGDGAIDRLVLGRRRRDFEHRCLPKPDVHPTPLDEVTDAGEDGGGGLSDGECTSVAENPPRACKRRPVPVKKAAVPSARAFATEGRLQQADARRGLELTDRKRCPESGVAPTDDRDVDLEVALERRLRPDGPGLVEPPWPPGRGQGSRRT